MGDRQHGWLNHPGLHRSPAPLRRRWPMRLAVGIVGIGVILALVWVAS